MFVSGASAPHDPANGIFRGATPAEEVRNSLQSIAALLEEIGSSLSRVVQVSMLINDPADYAACNAEYVKHFPGGLPARHTARFGVPDGGAGRLRVHRPGVIRAAWDRVVGCAHPSAIL